MADRLRFHLDENTDPAIARALRRYGIETSTTQEAGLRTQSDTAQWEARLPRRSGDGHARY